MLAYARRHLHHALSAPRYYIVGLVKRLFSNPVPIWCQAISFKVLTTLLPLILLATGIFGLVLRQANPFETVATYLRTFLPPNQSEQLVEMVFELQKASGALTVAGAAFFLVTVLTLFGTVRYVIGQAIGRDRHNDRSVLKGYLFDFRMVAQVGLLFLISFGVTFAVNTLSVQTTAWGANAGLDPETLQRGWRFVLRIVTVLVPWALSLAMFFQLFYYIPRPRPPVKSALFGATVTAILFELAKNGFTFYARYFGRFDRYSDGEGGLGSLGGVFGLILILVFWVYISGLTLVIGAMTAALHEARHEPRRRSALRRVWRLLRQRDRRLEAAHAANRLTPDGIKESGDGMSTDAVLEPDLAPTTAPEPTPPTTGGVKEPPDA